MDASSRREADDSVPPRRRNPTRWGIFALLIVVVALAARLWDLDRRCLCHPENYVPGIAMPDWVRHPPPRVDISSTIKSTLRDAHPPLYYYAMYPWAKLFGTGATSLRMPSVLLGAASVLLLWRIALREAGQLTALLAAVLLALHGHHVYWSQTARMYAPAAFLSLLSTWLLWRVFEDGTLRSRALYGLSTIAALWTHVYCWPVFLAQIVWASLRSIRERTQPVALGSQFLVLVLSLPVLALAIFEYRPTVSGDPRLEFFELGYLFLRGAVFRGPAPEPPVPHAVLLAAGILTLILGLLARPRPAIAAAADAPGAAQTRFRLALPFAGAVTTLGLLCGTVQGCQAGTKLFWISLAVSALPGALAAAFPLVQDRMRRLAAVPAGLVPRLAVRMRRLSPLVVILAFGSIALVSLSKDTFVARGTVVFLPYLLLLVASGVSPEGRLRWIGAPAAALLVALHVGSLLYFHDADHSVRDYRGFAADLCKELAPEDRILVTNEYTDPPLFYYMPAERWAQMVPDHYREAVATGRGRVWVVLYEDQEMPPDIVAAVGGLREEAPLLAPGSRARLFTR